MNMGDIIYQIILLALIVLGVISFTLFIRRLLINSAVKNTHAKELGEKLDKIIEILERNNK